MRFLPRRKPVPEPLAETRRFPAKMEPNNRLEKPATAGFETLEGAPETCRSAGVVSGRRPRQSPAHKIQRRSQFGAACCAGKTGVITVLWRGALHPAAGSAPEGGDCPPNIPAPGLH